MAAKLANGVLGVHQHCCYMPQSRCSCQGVLVYACVYLFCVLYNKIIQLLINLKWGEAGCSTENLYSGLVILLFFMSPIWARI